ncbi:F0F1 ATP synthase subunit A [Candidatus Parcubacteria bacterium]|nr:F0F1 ATP synthase subunit A [Candidatus Parcubacteria bacterium]
MSLFFAAAEAAEEGPHIAIAPDTLFEIAGFPITNSMVYGWIAAIFIIFVLATAYRKMKLAGSKGFAGMVEAGVEFIVGMLENTLGNRRLAVRYTPIFAALFFFIMFNNWLGLLPGTGPTFEYGGHPILRAFTADLNATFAMALFGMILVQVLALREQGPKNHIKHYFPLKVYNPFNYLIGAFEIFTEFTRLISLGLRLFLNIAIGEILIAVSAYLGGSVASVAALPFTLFEIFVGALQAFIFVVLVAAYLSATMAGHGNEQVEPVQR